MTCDCSWSWTNRGQQHPLCIPSLGLHSPGSIKQEKSLAEGRRDAVGRTRFPHRCRSSLSVFYSSLSDSCSGQRWNSLHRDLQAPGDAVIQGKTGQGWDGTCRQWQLAAFMLLFFEGPCPSPAPSPRPFLTLISISSLPPHPHFHLLPPHHFPRTQRPNLVTLP